MSDDTISTAYTIALLNLRNGYQIDGIHAGRSHFADIWARDSLFASFGALEVLDFDQVKNNLFTLLTYANKNGQIPLRVGQKYFLLRYFGINLPKEARFIEDKEVSIPTDPNSLFIIVFEKYITKTKDLDFVKKHFKKLRLIMDWNFSQSKDESFLMEEGHFASWADSLKKSGKVLYTNVLHYKAIKSFSNLCKLINQPILYEDYHKRSELVKRNINYLFWEKNYYIDYINNETKRKIFSSDGNLMAILFEVADGPKALEIEKTIKYLKMDDSICIKTNFPKYKISEIYAPFLLTKLREYHNGFYWSWLGCIHAVTRHKLGLKAEAETALKNLAKKIIEHKGIFEVYGKHEKPIDSFFYKSEIGFAWAAGLFVWACKEIGLK